MRIQSLTTDECPAYILAGGHSSRFGSDKALVEIDGQMQLLRLESSLIASGHSTYIVADRADRYAALGRDCLVDRCPDAGPLAALATALQHRVQQAGPGWILLISCDQLHWQAEWWSQLAEQTGMDRQVVAFKQSESSKAPSIQPIPGLYHSSVMDEVHLHLASQSRALRRLIEACKSFGVSSSQNPRQCSFNTVEELELLLQNRQSGDKNK